MSNRVVVAILAAVLVYAAFSWKSVKQEEKQSPFSMEGYRPASRVIQQTFEPALVQAPQEADEMYAMVGGGPNAPSVGPPPATRQQIVHVTPEQPHDPSEKQYESAEVPERLRYPEKAYGPGIVNDEQRNAVESGIASDAHQITTKAYQTFGPEFVQNGGIFMGNGVMANDVEVPSNYSSI